MSSYSYEHRWQSDASGRITWATQRLIVLNVLAFGLQLLLFIPLGGGEVPGGLFTHWLSFQPLALLRGALWKPLTYMFLHGGLMHLFINMLWLFFFGPDVERALGTRQFVRFYLICGALGVFATFLTVWLSQVQESVVGASGAVMGVMVAYAIISPDRQFFLFPLPIPINARTLVYIVIAMNIITAMQGGGNTSVATHLGGMAVGYAYMKTLPKFHRWQRTRQRKPKPHPENTSKKGTSSHSDVGEAVDNIFKFKKK